MFGLGEATFENEKTLPGFPLLTTKKVSGTKTTVTKKGPTCSWYSRLGRGNTFLQEKNFARSNNPVVNTVSIRVDGGNYSGDLDGTSFRWCEHLPGCVGPAGIGEEYRDWEVGPSIKPVVGVWTAGETGLILVARKHCEAQVNCR